MTAPAPAIMPDGINSLAAGIARDFPTAARVAGYINGAYARSQADWDLVPNAGDVLDVETGDATPDQAAGWVRMRKAAGLYRPTVYCSRSSVPMVRAVTGSYILGVDYDIWVADYTGSPHEVTAPGSPVATCAATQYVSISNYDMSAVYDSAWPHRTPPAPPAPPLPGGAVSQSATGHTTRTINVSRSGGILYSGSYATVVKTLTGKVVASDTSKDTHVTLTVPGAGIYTVTTAATGRKNASRKVIVL
jgi:hypothetical protein